MNRELERELIKKAQENVAAFEELYNYYLPKIYGYLLNRIGQKELAEDLTSEVFAKALANLTKYDDRGIAFSAWLFKIARNTLIDYVRKKKEILVEPAEIREIKMDSPTLTATDKLEHGEKRTLIRKTLNHLPEKYQTVLSLKFFEEMSNDEIAEIVGCRKGAVAVRIHRALRLMQRNLLKDPTFLEMSLESR